jgi:hypothetical protein
MGCVALGVGVDGDSPCISFISMLGCSCSGVQS